MKTNGAQIIAMLEATMGEALDIEVARRVCGALMLLGLDPAIINSALDRAQKRQRRALYRLMAELDAAVLAAEVAWRHPDDQPENQPEMWTEEITDAATALHLAAKGVLRADD
jgi:hypothetical protein